MQEALHLSLSFAQDPQPQQPGPVNTGVSGGPAGTNPAPGTTGSQTPGTPSGAQPACADSGVLWMMPLFLVLMYFMAIRPEQKRKKAMQLQMASLRAGDVAVTIGGMHGIVHQVEDRTVVLRVDTVKVTVDKTAIARVEPRDGSRPEGK